MQFDGKISCGSAPFTGALSVCALELLSAQLDRVLKSLCYFCIVRLEAVGLKERLCCILKSLQSLGCASLAVPGLHSRSTQNVMAELATVGVCFMILWLMISEGTAAAISGHSHLPQCCAWVGCPAQL